MDKIRKHIFNGVKKFTIPVTFASYLLDLENTNTKEINEIKNLLKQSEYEKQTLSKKHGP